MSKLRKQLEAGRDDYRQVKYPGDLADEMLRPTMSIGKWAGAIGLLAAAALIVVALRVHPGSESTEVPSINGGSGGEIVKAETSQDINVSTGGVPEFSTADSSELSFAPSGYGFSASIPSFWSSEQDETESTTTQTKKEPV